MSEVAQILALWQDAGRRGESCVLATVVRVEGSSYRKPGARMLITEDGRRAGTISGGCLEAEVVRKAFWLTERGAAVECYQSSFDDDGSAPFGLGCGGSIFVLLERVPGRVPERVESSGGIMMAIERSRAERISSAIVTVVDTNPASQATGLLGRRLILSENGLVEGELSGDAAVLAVARATLANKQSSRHTLTPGGEAVEVFAEYLARAISFVVFGAGDDAQPVVEAAAALGWQVTVADGRANLVRPERFPLARGTVSIEMSDPLRGIDIGRADAAVVMTHSFEQDRSALTALLQTDIAYIGVLGPRQRTTRLVAEVAAANGIDGHEYMRRLHSPVGLDLGADTPASIALSIVAEVFSVLRERSARSLTVKAMRDSVGASA